MNKIKIEQSYYIFLIYNKMPLSIMPLSLSFVPLPLNAKKLISEYSKPLSRQDWRTFERTINPNLFIEDIIDTTILKRTSLFLRVHINMRCSTFYEMYVHIEYSGIDSYIRWYGGCKETILSNRWLAIKQKDYEII